MNNSKIHTSALINSSNSDYDILNWAIELQRSGGRDELSGRTFFMLDLMNIDLSGLHMSHTSFNHCSFHGTDMGGIKLNMVEFFNCDLSEAVNLDKGELSEGSNAFEDQYIGGELYRNAI
jgi:uncharacterized protein YjbI with pentapeptide repeats